MGMQIRFLLSDPQGDVELSQAYLEQPFLTGPAEQHPFLSLKDYFGALQQFITLQKGAVLEDALIKQSDQYPGVLSDITEVIIRSEKHGAFCHIASIEPRGLAIPCKFAVTTALSPSAKESLQEEFAIMQKLAQMPEIFLPSIFSIESVTWQTPTGEEEFLMVLGEWLSGYHEWHLSDNPATGKHQIKLWDYEQGYRFLSTAESYDILRQAAFILTYYYNQDEFRQIYPWHHGAGDFVVRADPKLIAVKLITIRQYEPLVYFEQEEGRDRLVAAIHFLLNLCLRMRLDRLDGTGSPAWFDSFGINAALEGFFAGLITSREEGRLQVPLEEFCEIMRSFSAREIYDMHDSLLAMYAAENEDEFSLIQEKLPEHAEQLHAALQEFTLR